MPIRHIGIKSGRDLPEQAVTCVVIRIYKYLIVSQGLLDVRPAISSINDDQQVANLFGT